MRHIVLHRWFAAAAAAPMFAACGAAPTVSRIQASDEAARAAFTLGAVHASPAPAPQAPDERAMVGPCGPTEWLVAGATNAVGAPDHEAGSFGRRERGAFDDGGSLLGVPADDDAVLADGREGDAEPFSPPPIGLRAPGIARERATGVGQAATEDYTTSQYGIETELLQPFVPEVGIITFKGSKTLWGKNGESHGDALLGVFLRPNVSHDVVDTIDEYQASIGYRHYFWQGLHAEVQYLAGYVWGKNNLVDGKDYEGFVQFAEANIGYRIDFAKDQQRGFYIIPQFGYIQGLNEELIIGPRNGKDDTFWQGKLLVGYRF